MQHSLVHVLRIKHVLLSDNKKKKKEKKKVK